MKINKSEIKYVIRIVRTIKNLPTYFVDNFSGEQKYIVIVLRNGIKYRIRSRTLDRGILKEIWIQRAYTPKGFEINENDLVVDLGAHIGIFSILASKFAKNGRIYGFEPIPENFEMFKENLEINHIKNVIPICKAISDKKGTKEIFLSGNTGGHSFYFCRDKNKKINVQTISLKDVVEQNDLPRIDFLKMDCEGAEYEILFSCPDNILKVIRKISLEYHRIDDKRNLLSLKRFLEEKGFDVIEGVDLSSTRWCPAGMIHAKR